MTIYKLTNDLVAIPEDYVILCMTEEELRRLITPDWKTSQFFEDTNGNLYTFQSNTKSVIIVKKGDRR